MKRLLLGFSGLVGFWLVISPWFLNYRFLAGRWYDFAAGVVVLLVVVLFIVVGSKHRALSIVPSWLIGVIGVWLIVSGAILLGAGGGAGRWNEIIPGILLVISVLKAAQIVEGAVVRLYTREGAVMVEASKLERRGDDLVMKGKIMGAMPATIYIRPEEVWAGLGLVTRQILFYLPLLLIRGWLRRNSLKR
ncbi:MAG: hypothetical protein ABH839_04085 [Chloroflexota bacterium]